MKTATPATKYPSVVTEGEFDQLVNNLSNESADSRPDLSITYQPISDGVRVLAVGSLDECAVMTGNALRQHPSMRGAKVKSIFVRVPATRFRCL